MPNDQPTPQMLAVIGTRAQAIKMAPVVRALRERGLACEIVLTGQHETTMDELLADFELQPDTRLWASGEVKSVVRGLGWMPRILYRATRHLAHRRRAGPVTVLVHGDTMTTLVGAIAGRLARARVAHVEAGLRSGSLLDPFPEELVRRIVTRLAHVAYCPGPAYMAAAAGRKRRCVDTAENTVLDAVRWALDHHEPDASPPDDEPGVIVSAHRMETVMVRPRLQALCNLVLAISNDVAVRFVLHPVTQARLEHAGLLATLEEAPRVTLVPRMGYTAFIALASRARAVLTDGGGNQEEMSYLGVPTLLLRRRTERVHGLGSTTILTGLDGQRVRTALAGYPRSPRPREALEHWARHQPSQTIARDLADTALHGRE